MSETPTTTILKIILQYASNLYCNTFSGFKKALLQNPREMIRGRIFSEMIRIQARKSELQAESRSYGPKVGDTAGQTPRIRTESPRNGPRMGFRCFYRNPPLKPSWIHLSNTPPICIAAFRCPYALRKGNLVSTPPTCIAVRLQFVLQYHARRKSVSQVLFRRGTI